MVSAVIATLIASFLWGVTNHIDKFMINGTDESYGSIKTLLIFSTLIAGSVFAPIWLIISKFSVSISLISLVSVIWAGITYTSATYAYFKALEDNDASMIVIMFQLIPVFSYIISLILFKENLTIPQMVGSVIIILSAVIISFDFKEKNNGKKTKAMILMALSSLLFAIYYIFFDVALRNSSYNSCIFWYQIAIIFIGLFFISIKSFRNTFFKAVKTNGKKYFSLNILNEVIAIIANSLVNWANLLIPIALANVLNGFQGAFVFILGAIGVKLLPKYFKEDLSNEIVIQKISSIVLSVIGLIIMFL